MELHLLSLEKEEMIKCINTHYSIKIVSSMVLKIFLPTKQIGSQKNEQKKSL